MDFTYLARLLLAGVASTYETITGIGLSPDIYLFKFLLVKEEKMKQGRDKFKSNMAVLVALVTIFGAISSTG